MRTLFLLTVLVSLLVIVTKRPEQSFWQAAHGLWGKVETTASEVAKAPPVPTLTGNAREDFAALQKWVRAVDGKSPAAGSKDGTDREGGVARSEPFSAPSSPSARLRFPASGKTEAPTFSVGGGEILPSPKVTDMPELPAVPVAPVEVGEIGENPLSPDRLRPAQPGRSSFGEVKASYENASRFLTEIK